VGVCGWEEGKQLVGWEMDKTHAIVHSQPEISHESSHSDPKPFHSAKQMFGSGWG